MNGKKLILMAMVMLICVGMAQSAVSIYDVQYTADPSGDSSYVGSTIDCAGGIVIDKWVGGSTKLTIYDPANPNGWGGVISKTRGGEFAGVNVGDWVSFANVFVEERSGNTQLTFDATLTTDPTNPGYGSSFIVKNTGNALPTGIVVTENSFSEAYESMRVVLEGVEVTARDLGRKSDNYNLLNGNGNYFAADYMNGNVVFEPYHSLASIGAEFDSVSGIIEHKAKDGWDYYQMLTTGTSDFVVPEPATMALVAVGGLLLRRRRKAQ